MSSSATSAASFQVSNGQIIGPDGNAFVANGINVMFGNNPTVAQLQQDFPGINYVRLACYDYPSVQSLEAYVDSLTAKGIVVEIENHTNSTDQNAGGSQGVEFSGSMLTQETNWYSQVASAFKSNPYVWFGTNNEPSETNANGQNDPAALSAWQETTYNAIRAAGDTAPVLLEAVAWSNNGQPVVNQGYNAADYAGMTNVVWDEHFYGWLTNGDTSQADNDAYLKQYVAAAQQIKSADGTVPVIFGEFGDSTTGQSIDANGTQVINSVLNSGVGYAAWAWAVNPSGGDGLLSDSNGSLSAYGKEVAAGIAASAAKRASGPTTPPATTSGGGGSTTTPTTPPSTPTSPKELTTTSGGSLTDSAGNAWTLTAAGVVDENGSAVPGSAGTAAIALVNNVIYGQDATSKSWYTYSPTTKTWTSSAAPVLTTTPPATTSGGAGSTTTPTTPPSTPTSPKELTTTSGGSLTDSAGNAWTLTAAGVVDENGSAVPGSAGTAAIALVNNVIYGQDATSKSWYTYSPTTKIWTSSAAPVLTTTTPTTPTTTPAPTPKELTTTSGGSLTDNAGNAWTLTSVGVVNENGSAVAGSAGTSAIALVSNVIYGQDAASKSWYTYSPTTKTWTSSAAPVLTTTPAATSVTIAATQTSATISASHVSITATAGDHMVFISGTGDSVNLSGGRNTISDTGSGNTYVIPAAGKGYDTFSTNILTASDTLDLRTALAATNWTGSTSTLSKYLSVTNGAQGTVLSIAPTAGGAGVALATIQGTSNTTLSGLLAHAIT